MKKRKGIILMLLCAVVVFSSCKESKVLTNADTEAVVPEIKTADSDIESAGVETEIADPEIKTAVPPIDIPAPETQTVKSTAPVSENENHKIQTELVIYFGNSNADGYETELLTVDEVSPDIIIDNLAIHNIVSVDTKVKGFEEYEEDGKQIAALDLSIEFAKYLETIGTSGEQIIMGAITQTFLTVYEADALRLTVEGNVLETAHAVYSDLLVK